MFLIGEKGAIRGLGNSPPTEALASGESIIKMLDRKIKNVPWHVLLNNRPFAAKGHVIQNATLKSKHPSELT